MTTSIPSQILFKDSSEDKTRNLETATTQAVKEDNFYLGTDVTENLKDNPEHYSMTLKLKGNLNPKTMNSQSYQGCLSIVLSPF